jgi:hypothetical protein
MILAEKEEVSSLKEVVAEHSGLKEVESEESEDDNDDCNLMVDVERKRKREANEDRLGYRNANFILGSAAEVERLWSMAGLRMTEKRYSTSPMNFESISFLKFNRKWWDTSTIARAVRAVEQLGSSNKRFDKAEEEEMDTAQFLDQVNEY